jgi:hypothetical protein
MRIFSVILAALFAASPAVFAESPARANKVDYLKVSPGDKMETFNSRYSGFAVKSSSNFLELEKRTALDYAIFVRRPKGAVFFDRFVRVIPAKIHSAPQPGQCDAPSEAVSLTMAETGEEVLYAYSFTACADDPLVSPGRFLDKYMERYGSYDEKDYDRGQHVYNNVNSRYQVRVKPVALPSKISALIITVIDEKVFNDAYRSARVKLRDAEETTREKF